MNKFFNKNFIIGLDIGSGSVKMAQFVKDERGLRIVRTAIREISSDALPGLKEVLKDLDIRQCHFHAAVNCPLTMTRAEIFPIMPAVELRDAIRFEAKNYFPFALEEAFWDFESLGEVVVNGVRKQKVVLAASPKNTVYKMISLLEKTGVKPSLFVPVPLALQKIVGMAHPKEGEAQAVLDIGERFTELAVFSGKELVFQRKIPIAGSDFTKSMTAVLVSDLGRTELPLPEAERLKRTVGFPATASADFVEGNISSAQIFSMIRQPAEQLASEISRCFDYYRESSAGPKIRRLVLFGGGALLKGLPEFLSKELGVEVGLDETASDGAGLISHRFALAIGAAFSESSGINLLPPEIKEETKRTFERAGIQSALIGGALILFLIYLGMGIQLMNYEKRTVVARQELKSLGAQVETARGRKTAAQIVADQPYWEDVFKELGAIIPKDVVLTEWSKQGNQLTLKGTVTGASREETLSSFIFGLEKGIFKNVKLVASKETAQKNANEFELNAWVD